MGTVLTGSDPRIPEALLDPAAYPHAATDIRLIETHISWVLLAGEFAYKLKKPVNLGFLDFSRLEQRLHFCREELRLNRRLAPSMYLDVAPLRRTEHGLRFSEVCAEAKDPLADSPAQESPVVEYAVRMRRFPQHAQLDRQLAAGNLEPSDMESMAALIAEFHTHAARIPAASDWGTPDAVVAPVRENFAQLGQFLDTPGLARLERWSRTTFARLESRFAVRRAAGFVRECHGDLHLRNMARSGDGFIAFDGIEFEPALRWIDIFSDLAFLVMDLESRGHRDLAWRLLNHWLAITGDYAGLDLLPWYLVYRHLVRAKVDGIRLQQSGTDAAEQEYLRQRIDRHLALAEATAQPGNAGMAPALLMTCGLSGSGKSWLARELSGLLPAIVLRSDIERKRMFGPGRKDGPLDQGIYSHQSTAFTYARLRDLARAVLRSGHTVIVDASFLKPDRRAPFIELAGQLGANYLWLRCEAPSGVLQQRVAARAQAGDDPSDAGPDVLAAQLEAAELPAADSAQTLTVCTDDTLDYQGLLKQIHERLGAS